MIISIHIPKCAGTSFRQILDSAYGDRIWHNYGVIFSREQARPGLVPPGARAIHGHFIADSFDDLFPGRRLITWVRHPVERLVSNYHHFLRSPDMRDDCCRIVHERGLGLREFADLDWMRNMATRYLANKPLRDFEFVGIAERFGDSMDVFCRELGFRSIPRVPQENANPDRLTARYAISEADFAHIAERNSVDMDWYGQAAQRLSLEWQQGASRIA